MTPDRFIAKWQAATLKERSAAQEHFIDLCRLLDEPTPAEADPSGAWYCFEKGAAKAGGGDGWADVWRRNRFGWEYKGKGKDLQSAFRQLQLYTPALEYPPLLIVSDIETIVIHTAFTGTVPDVHVLTLEDLRDAAKRRLLKWAFSEPERLRPGQTTAALTEEAAGRFGTLAQTLRARGHDPLAVGHFCIRLLFCLFAEDIALLPRQMFTRLLDAGLQQPALLSGMLETLFGAMATGGLIGFEPIDRFNGGLFDSKDALPLAFDDIQTLRALAGLDWSAIEPSIFGTLFERGLDPDKRSQLGAHYTDRAAIVRLVDPVVLAPLRDEWSAQKAAIAALTAKAASAKSAAARTKAKNEAHTLLQGFLSRLARFRVLDPACGSGNFLLLSLLGLKDLEHRVILEAETLGLPRAFPLVGPECALGIELNPYAAELARVTVWIGEIQWMLNHGFSLSKDPILKTLNTIAQRDAVLNPDGSEPEWPAADVIVGNPPFLGDKKMLGVLGSKYVAQLRKLYAGRVPGGADLVTYWFEKARAQIAMGKARYAGLVATNSIRGGANRKVLERILQTESTSEIGGLHDDGDVRHAISRGQAQSGRYPARTGGGGSACDRRGTGGAGDQDPSGSDPGKDAGTDADRPGRPEMDDRGSVGGGDVARHQKLLLAGRLRIFNAWSDEPWINDGAAVRVSLVAFGSDACGRPLLLDGKPTLAIYPDLSGATALHENDLTKAKALTENLGVAIQGPTKGGAFEIAGETARRWLLQPNAHGKSNSCVLKPWSNGLDITRRHLDRWIIDFTEMDEAESSLFEVPFEHARSVVFPARQAVARERRKRYWWQFNEPAPGLRSALSVLCRYIATPEVSKYRVFVWLNTPTVPDKNLVVIAREDDATFGVLQSRFHAIWALKTGTSLENRPRYTSSSTFRTFPFPPGLTPADTAGPTETLDSGIVLPPVAPERRAAAIAIAEAAHRLNALRERWLNPPEWVERVPEVVPGYPERIVPQPEHAAELKQRTLTNLYNARPAWLDHAHRALDAAVAAAYGWADAGPQMTEEETLRRLLALNLERSP